MNVNSQASLKVDTFISLVADYKTILNELGIKTRINYYQEEALNKGGKLQVIGRDTSKVTIKDLLNDYDYDGIISSKLEFSDSGNLRLVVDYSHPEGIKVSKEDVNLEVTEGCLSNLKQRGYSFNGVHWLSLPLFCTKYKEKILIGYKKSGLRDTKGLAEVLATSIEKKFTKYNLSFDRYDFTLTTPEGKVKKLKINSVEDFVNTFSSSSVSIYINDFIYIEKSSGEDMHGQGYIPNGVYQLSVGY